MLGRNSGRLGKGFRVGERGVWVPRRGLWCIRIHRQGRGGPYWCSVVSLLEGYDRGGNKLEEEATGRVKRSVAH